MTDVIELDEQESTRIRIAKLRQALTLAPNLAQEMAHATLPDGGRTEAGEDIRVARIPFRSHALDDLNDLYAVMVELIVEWDELTREGFPIAAAHARWQRRKFDDGESTHLVDSVYGLPERFTPSGAADMVRSLGIWMQPRLERITAERFGADFADDFTRRVTTLRHRYGLQIAGARTVSPRPCPYCGSPVVVSYFGETFSAAEGRGEFSRPSNAEDRRDPKTGAGEHVLALLEGVSVDCEWCGWCPANSATQMLRWIEGDRANRPGTVQRVPLGAGPPSPTNQTEKRARLARADYWTPAEAGFMLGQDKRTITRWVENGMPAEVGKDHKGRKRLRIRRYDAHRWNESPDRRTRRKRAATS